ncbi:MAG: ABC transporter permease [Muribaculaceae bacterium]|nr:ABC transporter permease [Muribaculaceae bacterium]
MKQILKSIIARPGRSVGLLIEIIIITVIGWMVIEPMAVKISIVLTPAGYDYERLVKMTLSNIDRASEKYDSLFPSDKEHRNTAYARLRRQLLLHPDVEKATFVYYQGFENTSYSGNQVKPDTTVYRLEGDNALSVTTITYKPGTDFFETFGIKDVYGNPFTEPHNDGNSYIASRTIAKAISPKASVIGKNLFNWDSNSEPTPIIAVTADMPYRKGDGRRAVFFEADPEKDWSKPNGITVRLKTGVNPRAFIESITSDLSRYRSGNVYLTHPQYMADMRNDVFASQQRELTQKWIIVVFFLVNMFLGIAGSFYVQCKARIPDAGVMRAFGATRKRVEGSIIGEACLLAFAGWMLGSIIALIYLKSQGFPMETDADLLTQIINPVWHDTKLGRYSVIGGIILLLLLVTSALGAWLPARKVGRVPIVDSLRDE